MRPRDGMVTRNETNLISTERTASFRPLHNFTSVKYGVLWGHEHSGDGWSCLGQQHLGLDFRTFADEGAQVMSGDYQSSVHWGSPTARARMTSHMDLIVARGSKSGKVAIYASSMGTLLALLWIRENPSLLAAAGLALPITDLEDFYDNHMTAPWKAEMYAAWGMTQAQTEAAIALVNPATHMADYVGLPIALMPSDNDALIGTTAAPAFVAGTDCVAEYFTGHPLAGGHTYPPNADFLTNFIRARL